MSTQRGDIIVSTVETVVSKCLIAPWFICGPLLPIRAVSQLSNICSDGSLGAAYLPHWLSINPRKGMNFFCTLISLLWHHAISISKRFHWLLLGNKPQELTKYNSMVESISACIQFLYMAYIVDQQINARLNGRENSDYKTRHHHEACNELILGNMYNQHAKPCCPSLLPIADFLLLCPVLLIHTHLVYLDPNSSQFYSPLQWGIVYSICTYEQKMLPRVTKSYSDMATAGSSSHISSETASQPFGVLVFMHAC